MSPTTLRADTRPRLSPGAVLLDRPDGELQVGLDPGWRIPDPTGRWRRLLRRLDGSRSWRQLTADRAAPGAPADDEAEAARLVESLAAAGLADFGRPHPPPLRCLRLVGTGPTAAAIADRLLASGVHRLYVVDPNGHDAQHLGERHPQQIRVARHWTTPELSPVPLTVVVADTAEVDRVIAADLVRHGLPHLLVRPRPTGSVLGPLVVPARTACLGCTDLHRRDTDPAWPLLLPQLAGTPTAYGPPAADWAAALTVLQVLAVFAGERPETWSATLELSGHTMSWRSWTRHRECGCRWAG